MWTYNSSNGLLSHNWSLVGSGYSGRGDGINNPAMADVPNFGPIPAGQYTMSPFFDDPGGKGPCVTRLTPAPGTNTHGRSGFMIHGDNSEHDRTASEGCIILGRTMRQQIRNSGDDQLEVV